MAFRGYLIASGSGSTIFPNKYISCETYKATPNQREEIKAYRDENTRDLTRVTAEGKKSKIVFSTREGLHLSEKQEIQAFFNNCMVDTNQRKVYLTFWDDENNVYKQGYFYLPNMDYTIRKITSNDIVYQALNYELIEY